MISLRLPRDMERKLDSVARIEGRTRSDVLKDSIALYLERHSTSTPYKLGKDLFGIVAGPADLASTRKSRVRARLLEKHEKRGAH